MHTHNGERERTEAGHPDGRRNDAGSSGQGAAAVVFPQVPHPADGALHVTHCNGVAFDKPLKIAIMSATLTGSGKVS